MRIEPPPSEPSASSPTPSASALAAPPELPPAERSGANGLPVCP